MFYPIAIHLKVGIQHVKKIVSIVDYVKKLLIGAGLGGFVIDLDTHVESEQQGISGQEVITPLTQTLSNKTLPSSYLS